MNSERLEKLFNGMNDRLINVELDYIKSLTGKDGSVYEAAVYKEYEQRAEEFKSMLGEAHQTQKIFDGTSDALTKNNILLQLTNQENENIITILLNGDFHYKDKLVTNDKDIVTSFRQFLNIE